MSIDYLQCICGHRKHKHYHGANQCDGYDDAGRICACMEFRTDMKKDQHHDASPSVTLDSGLKDSGQRLQFDSGMVRDVEDNKPGFHFLIPKDIPFEHQMLTRVAEHLRKGAKKYTPRNWEKGNSDEEAERARESALRHMYQWITGETDEDHAAAVITNIIFAETMQYKSDRKRVSNGSS